MKRRPIRGPLFEGEDKFWREVETILSTIFGVNPKIADDYRRLVSKGSAVQRDYVLHDEPRNVALELSGVELTDNERVEYFQMPHLDARFMQRRAQA